MTGGVRIARLSARGLDVIVLELEADVMLTSTLSRAEREVMRLCLAGRSNGSIAAERGVALRTIANQLAAVYQKLGVRSRAELAAAVSSHGLARTK